MSYFPQEVFRQGFDFSRDTPLERYRTIHDTSGTLMLGTLVGGAVDLVLKTPGIYTASSIALMGGVGFVNSRMLQGFERIFGDNGMIAQSEK